MVTYVIRRLLVAVPVLLAASVFTFTLVSVSGDPLSPLKERNPPVDAQTLHTISERLYQDRNPVERYWLWLTGLGDSHGDIGLLQGKFGPKMTESTTIGDDLLQKGVTSLRLLLAATILAMVLGVAAGVLSSVRQYSWVDHALTTIGFVFLAMPIFWVASLVREGGLWFNQLVGSNLLITFGATSTGYSAMSPGAKLGDIVAHLTLPTIALLLNGFAIYHRYQRSTMLEVIDSDYIRLARAKGLRWGTVLRRHALRNSLIPVMVIFTPALITAVGGAVVTEDVFRWDGMGTYLTFSIQNRDLFPVMDVVMVVGVFIIIGNLISDVMLAVLDPRIRL